MFCYKAKNYALYDGKKITLKGSALRSRGIEPYLKKLSDRLIQYLLGVTAYHKPLCRPSMRTMRRRTHRVGRW